MARLYGIANARQEPSEALVVLVELGGRRMGVVVDELLGLQQTVIKGLGYGVGRTEGLAGGGIMADGQVALIVDVVGLFKLAFRR
jgi:two-component system chemotaxis sensor kinase CheA